MWKPPIREWFLVCKVWCVNILVRMHLIKNVWYKCELDLSEIRAKRLYRLLNWNKDE